MSAASARNKRTSFAYNDLGQLVSITDPLLKTTSLTYDAAGNVATRTDRNGRLTKFYYDAANRLTGVDYNSNGTGLDEERHYDVFGNMDWIRNAAVTYTFTYDVLHRPTSRTDSRTGRQIAWEYDAVGNVIRRTGYEGDVTTFTYDSANRLVAMSNPDYLGAAYHYDEAGRLLDRIFSNGQRTVFGYDADSRLTETNQYDAAGTLLDRERYCLDNAGLLTTVLRGSTGTCAAPAGNRAAYVYDDLYRLTDEHVTTGGSTTTATDLAYDAVGNIDTAAGDADATFRDYVVDDANRLTELRSDTGALLARFDYDFEGNRTAKRNAAGTVIESYAYDDKNRLISLTAGGQTTTYTYDPFDYRIGQKTGSDERLYLLDGEHVEAVYTGSGLPLATYLRGAVIDEIVGAYHYDTTGQRTFYAFGHDRLTSVTRLTSHNGATIRTYGYGPFGADRAGGTASPNRLKYTGREQDPTGFYYYRARYYDPSTRRFLTEDPLGFTAGVNFYAYVENNPIIANDPTGHVLESPWDAANVALGMYSLQDNVRSGNLGWAAVDALGLAYDGAAMAVPFLPAGASAGFRAWRAGGTVYNSAEVGLDVARIADRTHDRALLIDSGRIPNQQAARIGTELHNDLHSLTPSLSDSLVSGFAGPNRAAGMPDVTWGSVPGVWADVTTSTRGSWERHVRQYGSEFGEGVPILYERGAGVTNSTRLNTGGGSSVSAAQSASDWAFDSSGGPYDK